MRKGDTMSRIGRVPIVVPPGVEVHITEENHVEVKGPKGLLRRRLHPRVLVHRNGTTIEVARRSEAKLDKSLHGLSRTLLHNMVVGVTTGFEKQLEIVWSGLRAHVQQKILILQFGHSLHITYEALEGSEFELSLT